MKKEDHEATSGQENIKALTTANAVTEDGTLVKPQEPVDIYATANSKHLGAEGTKHSVHRILAEKLVKKDAATMDAPKVKEGKK